MIDLKFLEFERPIAEIEARLEELQHLDDSKETINKETNRLKEESDTLTRKIFSKLTDWQVTQVSRHPMRPYSMDYINILFEDFVELHGDRMFSDDPAIIGGLCRLQGRPIMFIGHQKGRDTKERVRRNYGMPKPEGYRKSQRLMKLAEKFDLPVITFIDTPGAYPGLGAEERGQSEAIARSLYKMSQLSVPVISVVIGEGGSGGALAIGVADKLLMLEYSVYSVISPEGCASILWKNADLAEQAARAMSITASSLKNFRLIDEILNEPLGGAHRDPNEMSKTIQKALVRNLDELNRIDTGLLVEKRCAKIANFGEYMQV